jgi:hypothetical protein
VSQQIQLVRNAINKSEINIFFSAEGLREKASFCSTVKLIYVTNITLSWIPSNVMCIILLFATASRFKYRSGLSTILNCQLSFSSASHCLILCDTWLVGVEGDVIKVMVRAITNKLN